MNKNEENLQKVKKTRLLKTKYSIDFFHFPVIAIKLEFLDTGLLVSLLFDTLIQKTAETLILTLFSQKK